MRTPSISGRMLFGDPLDAMVICIDAINFVGCECLSLFFPIFVDLSAVSICTT